MMELTLTILKAQVLLRVGTDLVFLQVDKPSPFPLCVDDSPLHLTFEVLCNHGAEYCKTNFGVDPEIIDTRTSR